MNLWEEYFKAIRSQNWGKAIEILNKIKENEPENPQVFLKIGDTYQKIGDIEKAVPSYSQAAWLLLKDGFFQKALAVYKIILRLDPNNPEAINKTRDILLEIENIKQKPAVSQPVQESSTRAPSFAEDLISTMDTLEKKIEETSYTGGDGVLFETSPEIIPEFLKSIPQEEIRKILTQVNTLLFKAGEDVVVEGDSGTSIYVIKSGRARVSTHILGKKIDLTILERGDFFGEIAFLTGRLRTATVTAIEELEVLEFTGLLLERLIEQHPGILEKLQDFYYSRLQNTIKKVSK